MGGVAALARAAGFRVTGSDSAVYPPMSVPRAMNGYALWNGIVAVWMVIAYGYPVLPDGRPWYTMKEVRGQTLQRVLDELHAVSTDSWGTTADGFTFRRTKPGVASRGAATPMSTTAGTPRSRASASSSRASWGMKEMSA